MKTIAGAIALLAIAASAVGQLPSLGTPGSAPAPGGATPPRPASPPPAVTPPAAGPPRPATPPTPSSPPPAGSSPPTPGATPAAASAGTSGASSSSSTSGPSDADVLVFAYNLEVLEASFYSCAAFGTPLSSSITGNGPAPSTCTKANLSSSVGSYAAELAREEIAHVTLLYNSLTQAGASPVAPLVNIGTAFQAAAVAALGQDTLGGTTFDPYANDVFFLHGAFIFEDLGATAYLGALGLLQNATYRQVAAQIGNAESYHAALDRTLLYQQINTTPAFGRTVQQITSAIVAALNSLSGSPQLKYELTNSQGAAISNVDSNGLVPVASVAQVLKAVTLGAPSGSGGGFFPNNLVGNVKN